LLLTKQIACHRKPFVRRVPKENGRQRLDDRLHGRLVRSRRVLRGRGVQSAVCGQVRRSVHAQSHRSVRNGRPQRFDARDRLQSGRPTSRPGGGTPETRQVAEDHW